MGVDIISIIVYICQIVRQASRTDANQGVICAALHKLGCQTFYIKLPCDLLISGGPLGEANLLAEIKMPGEQLTAAQQEFWMRWPGRKCVLRSVAEAIEAVCGKKMLE